MRITTDGRPGCKHGIQSEEERVHVMRVTGRCLIVGWLLAVCTAVLAQQAGNHVTETRLCDLPQETTEYHPLVVSPDGRRVAYAVEVERQWQVLINGQAGPRYDEVRAITFSPDGHRVAYQARTGEQWRMVVDGQEGPLYQKLGRAVFSDDSRQLAVSAMWDRQWRTVADGQEGVAYDEIRDLFFSPKGVSSYAGRLGAQWHIVIGTQQGKLYDEVRELLFSADGTRRAYVARQGKVRFLVVDGVEKPHYDDIGVFDFSPDGRRFAYTGKDSKQEALVIDGTSVKRYDHVYSVIFSPDSRRLASSVETKWKRYQRVDGTEYGPYRDVSTPNFSPDSQHIGYHATRLQTGEGFVMVDGREQPYPGGIMVGMPIFSPDSQRVAYITSDRVVVDGRIDQNKFSSISWLAFSPDSRHVVYVGGDENGWVPVVDGKQRDWRGGMGRLVYSQDGKHLVFTAGLTDWNKKPGEGLTSKWWVVTDGQAGSAYDLILDPTVNICAEWELGRCYRYPGIPLLYTDYGQAWGRYLLWGDPQYPGIFFDTPDRIHYLAIKEKAIYLVETSLVETPTKE